MGLPNESSIGLIYLAPFAVRFGTSFYAVTTAVTYHELRVANEGRESMPIPTVFD